MKDKLAYDIFPNPIKNKLFIRSPFKNEVYNISIINNQGNNVYQNSVQAANGIFGIDLSKFSAGNYIIKINISLRSYSAPFIKL